MTTDEELGQAIAQLVREAPEHGPAAMGLAVLLYELVRPDRPYLTTTPATQMMWTGRRRPWWRRWPWRWLRG